MKRHSTREANDYGAARHAHLQREQGSAHRPPLASERHPGLPQSMLSDARLRGRSNEPARVALMQSIQQSYGNRALQRFLQRSAQGQPVPAQLMPIQRQDPPATTPTTPGTTPAPTVDPVKKQWEDDWNDPTFASAQSRFAGNGRPAGTPKERYDALCPLYKAKGILRPLKYAKEEIVDAKFFHQGTPAHKDVSAKLAKAEANLKELAAKAEKDGTEKIPLPPFKSAWAFNPRTTSKGGWSNHADGKAIDIDAEKNPHLTSQSERTVITLLSGYDIEKRNPGDTKGQDSYDAAKAASDAFKSNYNETGMTKRIGELKTDHTKLAKEQEELQTALAAVPKKVKISPKATKEERKKAQEEQAKNAATTKEITAKLKTKTGEVKDMAGKLKALENELKKYKNEQAAYTALGTSITDTETNITTLNADIEKLKGELAAAKAKTKEQLKEEGTTAAQHKANLKKLQTSLTAKQTAQKSAKTKLTKAQGDYDAYSMRKYAREGILNLPKVLVKAMTDAGFTWGGDWAESKDFMHFDSP
ncbi:MAG TPA: M15 family metallopeptidase [Chloroflexia bacterium]|nr:M15 family metallopeptidase [Chloroflexia bacterium]